MVRQKIKPVNRLLVATQYRYRFTVAAALCIVLIVFVSPSGGVEEVVDPHWSGEYCTECHVAGKIPERRFGGDVAQLCSRCHRDDPPTCVKVHTEDTILPDTMKKNIPADWPLTDSKITCLTCHAVLVQCVGETVNKNFLRSNEPEDTSGFCFNCHQKERFQKTNPHRPGSLGMASCFLCHAETLGSAMYELCFEASLKTKSPSLCMGCHGNLPKGHIVHEELGPDKLSASEAVLHELDAVGFELPLADGRMHCATCHNPHPKGIIGRKKAAIGAGEESFLRTPGGYYLCLACHTDKPIEEYVQGFQEE